MDAKVVARVRRVVWKYYRAHGRHELPWRLTTDPYSILVSEVMLQQTQVGRVIPKFEACMARFPTVDALAHAPLREVLVLWQGLGYNRRAKMLHEAMRVVSHSYGGVIPNAYEALVALPGIGPYTAGAVCVFSYNESHPLVETNIRTVIYHHLYAEHVQVSEDDIRSVSQALCPHRGAREWYWAMMDYGAYLKGCGVRVNAKNPHYRTQSSFRGSDRYVRGAIIRFLAEHPKKTERAFILLLDDIDSDRVRTLLQKLVDEGMVQYARGTYCLVGR